MKLAKDHIKVRELMAEDFPVMLKWLTDERVLEFYGGRDLRYTPESLRQHYEKPLRGDGWRVVIEYKGLPVGYGQIYRVGGALYEAYDDPQMNRVVYAMDQFIGEPDYWNRGIGSRYVQMVCQYLKSEKSADAVILDPHKDNPRAIRAYEKAGFEIIRELPAHELFEGERKDCWLMEAKL